MATSKELSEQINDITECSICSESFKEPKVLPCIHTFCLLCLEKYGEKKEKYSGDNVDCPLCRKMFTIPQTGFNGLPNNYFIIQLLQVSLQQPGGGGAEKKCVQCDLCSSVSHVSPAAAYCIECGQHLCEMCIGRHKSQKFAKTHKVVNLIEKPAAEELMKMMPSFCEQHPTDEIKLYCFDCNKTFCVVCYVDKHNTHKCSDVRKAAEDFLVQLDEDIGKLGIAKSQEELKELDEEKSKFVTKVEVTRREIGERYNKLRAMLDKHQKELLQELKSYEAKRLKEIETRIDEVERLFVTKESFKRYCTEMKDKGTPCEISRSAKDLRARTEELLKTEEELICRKLPSAALTLMPSTTSMENARNWIGELSYKTETQTEDRGLSTAVFLFKPTILQVIFSKTLLLRGIAVVGSEMFLGGDTSTQIEVYDTMTFTLTRHIPIPDSHKVLALAACSHNNCLYVSTHPAKSILRLDITNNSSFQWTLSGLCYGLSVTRSFNLLATLYDSKRIQEYTTQGSLIREIIISTESPFQSIELSSGEFVVCLQRKVSLVTSTGQVIKSFGEGSGYGQMFDPRQLSVDKSGNVTVVDYSNYRVVLLSPTLTLLGYLPTPGDKLEFPWPVNFDAMTGYLYIGEIQTGRVLVLKARASGQ